MRSEETESGVLEHWTPEEVRDAYDKNEIVLIDVRAPKEFAFETIEGALLSPITSLNPVKLPSQEGKPIVFYCGGGGRSRRAAEMTLRHSGGKIAHMEGGFGAWKKSGLPYVGTEEMTGTPTKVG